MEDGPSLGDGQSFLLEFIMGGPSSGYMTSVFPFLTILDFPLPCHCSVLFFTPLLNLAKNDL